VGDEEDYEKAGDEEMQGARGLAASEQVTVAGSAESKDGDRARPVR